MKKCAMLLGIYIAVTVIVTVSLRWYYWYTSSWWKVSASAWEEIIEQMQGEHQVPLDTVQVLASVDAWLQNRG